MKSESSRPTLTVLIESLGMQALAQLGELPLPGAESPTAPDLPRAKYTIDLIQVLRDKTDGNRDDDEEFIFDRLLYDLRMKYVARSGSS